MMTATDTRKEARNHLNNKWGKGALIAFCYFIIEMIMNFIVRLTENMDIIGFIVSIAQIIISVPLSYGIMISYMKLKRDEEVGAFDFLTSGFSSFVRAWKTGLSMMLKMILPIILTIIAIVIVAVFAAISVAQGASSTLMIIGVILLLAVAVYAYAVSLKYVLSFYIAYDEPDLSSKEVVEKSAKMMNNNRGNYFVLTLSFIGWAILGIITLGIGYFWLIPYIQVSQICFYEALKGNDENPVEQ